VLTHGTPIALAVDVSLPHRTSTERIPPRPGVIRYNGITAGFLTNIEKNGLGPSVVPVMATPVDTGIGEVLASIAQYGQWSYRLNKAPLERGGR